MIRSDGLRPCLDSLTYRLQRLRRGTDFQCRPAGRNDLATG
jgi:hypothetical protein